MKRAISAFFTLAFILAASITPSSAEEKAQTKGGKQPASSSPIITAPESKKQKEADNLVTEKILTDKKDKPATNVAGSAATGSAAAPVQPQAPFISAPGHASTPPTPIAGIIHSVDDVKKAGSAATGSAK